MSTPREAAASAGAAADRAEHAADAAAQAADVAITAAQLALELQPIRDALARLVADEVADDADRTRLQGILDRLQEQFLYFAGAAFLIGAAAEYVLGKAFA